MNAFITGSRAYGIPREDSDLDLVVCTDTTVKEALEAQFGRPCRIGALNLILVTSNAAYRAWANAKADCMAARPCSRKRAVEIHKARGVNAFGASRALTEEQ